MDAQAIQKVLDGIAAQEKSLTKHQIANRIESARRKGDPDYQKSCKTGQAKRIVKHSGRGAGVWVTPYGEFKGNKNEFRKFTGKDRDGCVRYKPHLFYLKKNGPGEVTTEKVYYSPYGAFQNSKEIWQLAVVNKCKFATVNWETNDYSPYFKKMMKKYPDQYYTKVEPKREWELEK